MGNSRKASFQDSMLSHPAVPLPGPTTGPAAHRPETSPDDLPAPSGGKITYQSETLQECPGARRLFGGEV